MKNKVAIVSGGAGDIGSAISRRLAQLGYSVVIADASKSDGQRVVAALGTDAGQQHRLLIGDLTQLDVAKRVVEHARGCGTITAIVNAVGISPKDNGMKINFHDITPELWDRVMAVNVKAPFLLIQQAAAYLPHDGTASIVNLLSVTSKWGSGGLSTDEFQPKLPSTAAYAASKAALHNLTATLARELSSYRIRVNGVAPGMIATRMTGHVAAKDDLAAQIPLGRWGTTGEVVDAIEFLLGDKSTYISGTSLDINGAWYTG